MTLLHGEIIMSAKSKHQITAQAVQIKIDEKVSINGDLSVTEGAKGIVLFAHGSGSSRFSPRNRFVAAPILQDPNLPASRRQPARRTGDESTHNQ